MRGQSFDPKTGKLGPMRDIPHKDALIVSSVSYSFKHGICQGVRQITDEYAARIEAIDLEIQRLRAEHADLCEEAFDHGSSVSQADFRQWVVSRKARTGSST